MLHGSPVNRTATRQRTILIVARDAGFRASLAQVLMPAGYVVELAEGSRRARQVATTERVDIAILVPDQLDDALPGLASELADRAGATILAAESPDRLQRLLPAGKGFRFASLDAHEILASVNEALRAPEADDAPGWVVPEVLSFEAFSLDLAGHVAVDGSGREIPLTAAEFATLVVFLRNPGRVLSRDQLRGAIGGATDPYDRSIDVMISRLRRKIEPDPKVPRIILTVPGAGYKFAAKPASTPPAAARTSDPVPPAAVGGLPPRAEAERRQLSIISCGLVATGLELEDMPEALAAYYGCVAEIADSFRGSVIRTVANMVLVAFGHPVARENDAELAVRAGLALCAAVEALTPGVAVPLRCQIGISTGPAIVGGLADEPSDRSVVGAPLAVAARLQMSAQPGSVAIDGPTRRLIGKLFDCCDIGEVDAGVRDLVSTYRVLGVSTVENRFEALHGAAPTPFVGRDEELALILRRWDDVKRDQGRVVVLTGEPGIGKSRLSRTVHEKLAAEPHTPLIYNCSPHHQDSAFHPIIAQLARAAGIVREDGAATKLDKVAALLAQGGDLIDGDVGLLAALLSIPGGDRFPVPPLTPRQLKERTLGALAAWVRRLCARKPVLMLFEDLQWIDPTSLEWLARIVEQADGIRLLLLATARPEFSAPWANHRHITSVPLSRLDRDEGQALITGVTHGKALPSHILDQIVARTDGVPLFVEELTKMVLESGLLREAGDRYELAGPLQPPAIPSTLQASLLARLDRHAAAKELAQIGAVIGREFSYSLVATVAALPEADLRAALSELASAELVFQRGYPPDATYVFKHALVQDTAYASLVKSRRQRLHGVIARALEQELPAIATPEQATAPRLAAASLLAMVAHHFTQAELPDQAIDYWLRAGEHALNCSANVEAVGHLTRGIELIDALPAPPERVDKSLRLHLALGAAMQATRGVGAPETLRAFSRARHLLDVRGTLADNMAVLRGLWNGYFIHGRLREAVDLLDRRPTLATPDGDAEVSALIDRFKGITLHMMGRFIDARAHLEQSIQFYAASQRGGTSAHFAYLTDDRIGATAYLTRTLWLLGYPEQARAVGARSLKRARARVHAMTVATALLSEMFLAAFSADRDHMAAAAAELLRHSLESKLASYEYWARLFQGVLMSGSGDPRGIEIMDGAVAAAARVGSGLSRPMVLCQLAHGHANLGRSELALAALDEGIEAAGAMAVGEHVAELRRFRGETLRSLGRKQEAAIELERALAIARDQQARWWELRVATSLARVWRDDGKPAEARQLLAPVYGWFAEGFDLPDLRTARALLDELDRQCRR